MRKETNCEKTGECLCEIRGILDVVSKKWTICIVSILEKNKPLRFNEIKNIIKDISPKSLADALKILEHEGLIHRKIYSEIPPRVEYALSKEGRNLKNALSPLLKWAQEKKITNDTKQ